MLAWLGSGHTAEGTLCLGAARFQLGMGCILRLFQGHFVLSCCLLLVLRENIPVPWEQAEEGKSQYSHSLKENGLGFLRLYYRDALFTWNNKDENFRPRNTSPYFLNDKRGFECLSNHPCRGMWSFGAALWLEILH